MQVHPKLCYLVCNDEKGQSAFDVQSKQQKWIGTNLPESKQKLLILSYIVTIMFVEFVLQAEQGHTWKYE